MTFTKAEIKRYLIILVVFLISGTIMYLTDNVVTHIVCFTISCITPIVSVNYDLFHPYCWFSGFFCIYSISYPLLHVMGYSLYGYNKVILLYELLALFVVLTVITPKKYSYDKSLITENFAIEIDGLNRILYVFMTLMLIVGAVYIYRAGFSNKKQIYSGTGIVMTFIFRIPLILTILFPLLIIDYYNKNKKLPIRDIILGFTSIATITAFSGERDLIFRFVFASVLLFNFIGYITKKHIVMLLPLFVASLPLSASFKYYFLSGNRSDNLDRGFMYALLTADFNSASQNLQYLVDYTDAKGTMGFSRIFYDFFSLFSSSLKSLTAWYNATYFPNAKAGRGFSLVGSGYVIGGVLGVVFLFVLVGLIIRWFYKYSRNNTWIFSAYLYFITLMIYSMRGDFSTILSGIIKQILPVEVILYLITLYSRKKLNKKERCGYGKST